MSRLRKISAAEATQTPAPSQTQGTADIVTLPRKELPLQLRQYYRQKAMLDANLASKAATAIHPDRLTVQYQRATRTPAQETTIRAQAQMQGLRGAAFKL